MKTNDRSVLHEQLPLKFPYLVQIFPCYACNFRCRYCLHSLPPEEHGDISSVRFLPLETYRKFIDSIADEGGVLKMLRFAGIGEPLLHPEIAEMVAYAQERRVAKTVDIVTNAAALTPKLSENLIKAGLSTLRVSIEGLSTEEYRENTGTAFPFEKIVSNIRFFYEHAKKTKVYVKIIDYMLDAPEKEQKFHMIFDSISHVTAVEHLTPTIKEIDYSAFSGNVDFLLTQDGEDKQNISVCPQPFYMLQLNPDGSFAPCCSMKLPMKLYKKGEGFARIWNGTELTEFRLALLEHKKNDTCRECALYQYGTYPQDVLDGFEEELLPAYKRFE